PNRSLEPGTRNSEPRTGTSNTNRERGTRNLELLQSSRPLHPLVRLFVLEAELVDQFRIELDVLAQLDGERLRVILRIVDGELDVECPVVRPRDPLGHLGDVAHRAASGVDPEIVAEALRADDQRVTFPGAHGISVPGRHGILREG